MLSAKGETRRRTAYITVVDQDQSIVRMSSRKEGDAHPCSSRASTPCRTHQTLLQLRGSEPSMPMSKAGEVQRLEKATNTSYGKITGPAGELDTVLETSQGQQASRLTSSRGYMSQR